MYLRTKLSRVQFQKLLQLPLLIEGGAVDAEVSVDGHNGVRVLKNFTWVSEELWRSKKGK